MDLLNKLQLAFPSIPSSMYTYLIVALLIGIAAGLLLGLTFVYSILVMPMQRRLKREVVNIQMDNEKLKKDFSHYKRRARRKLKYYRELEFRSVPALTYDKANAVTSSIEDDVDAAILRSERSVSELTPETAQEMNKSSRYAKAARLTEPVTGASESESAGIVHEVELGDDGAVESVRMQEPKLKNSAVALPPAAVLDDLTDLAAMADDVSKKGKSLRRPKGGFIESLRNTQELLAGKFGGVTELSGGLTQTIESPLQEGDVDKWQDFESEFDRELSDTSHALDITREIGIDDEELNATLQVDDTDVNVRRRRRSTKAKSEKPAAKPEKRGRSKKKRAAVIDDTVVVEDATRPQRRASSKDKTATDKKTRRRGKRKVSPVDGFISALRQQRNELQSEEYEADEVVSKKRRAS